MVKPLFVLILDPVPTLRKFLRSQLLAIDALHNERPPKFCYMPVVHYHALRSEVANNHPEHWPLTIRGTRVLPSSHPLVMT